MEPEITSSLDSRIPTVEVPARAPDHGNVIHSSTLHIEEVVDDLKGQISAATGPGEIPRRECGDLRGVSDLVRVHGGPGARVRGSVHRTAWRSVEGVGWLAKRALKATALSQGVA
jgi:hypothetical protein